MNQFTMDWNFRMQLPTIKITKLVLAVSFVCGTTLAYAATLQDAVNQTLMTHPEILSKKAEQKASDYDIRQAQGGLLPSFDVSAGIGHENTDNPATRATGEGDVNFTRQESNFIVRQLLFDGGNVTNQIRQAKANYTTRSYQVSESQQLLGFQAAQAYLNVLRNRELVTIAQYDVKAHESLFEKVEKRLKAGAGRKSELQLADSRLSLSLSNLDQAIGELHNANDTYIKIVGSAPTNYLSMPRPPQNIPNSLQEAQRLALAINPTIKATDAQIAATQAAQKIAKSAYYPTFTLDISQSYNDNLDGVKGYNNERLEMVRMNYNVFNGGSDKAAVDAANYRVTAAQNDAAATIRDTNENVALSWNNLQANLNRIPPLQTHVTQSYNVWQAYEKQFQLGQRTLFDLLNAQSEYYDARSALTQAEYDVRIARYRLLASMGNFVSTIENTNRNILADTYQASWPESGSNIGVLSMSTGLSIDRANMAPGFINNNYLLSPRRTSISKAPRPTDLEAVKKHKEQAVKPLPSNPQIDFMSKPNNKKTTNTTNAEIIKQSELVKAKTQVQKTKHASTIPTKMAEPAQMDKYTIQLAVTANKKALDKIAQKTHITKQSQVFRMKIGKKEEYVLTYGHYKTKSAAEYALHSLPKAVQKLKPYVQPISKYTSAQKISA